MLAVTVDPPSLILQDHFRSSKSTPLILAAKTGNNMAAMLIIGLLKSSKSLDTQDYSGNTALHYAAKMRNNPLIEALILNGADLNIRNDMGESALECYLAKTTNDDLTYNYGTYEDLIYLMRKVCDWDQSYQGTKNLRYSNYRWFLPHIIHNFAAQLSKIVGLEKSSVNFDATKGTFYSFNVKNYFQLSKSNNVTLKEIIITHLKERQPVIDIRIYQAMVTLFVEFRENCHQPKIQYLLPERMNTLGQNGFTLYATYVDDQADSAQKPIQTPNHSRPPSPH